MLNMKYSFIQLRDLPDEILMTIFKNLYNFEVLYSLMDVNDRFNTIAHDSMFTSHLRLMTYLSDNSICSLPYPMLDCLCSQILPEIQHKIKWLDLESSSMKRILCATNYPNLYGLGLYYIDMEAAQSLIIGKTFLILLFIIR